MKRMENKVKLFSIMGQDQNLIFGSCKRVSSGHFLNILN